MDIFYPSDQQPTKTPESPIKKEIQFLPDNFFELIEQSQIKKLQNSLPNTPQLEDEALLNLKHRYTIQRVKVKNEEDEWNNATSFRGNACHLIILDNCGRYGDYNGQSVEIKTIDGDQSIEVNEGTALVNSDLETICMVDGYNEWEDPY